MIAVAAVVAATVAPGLFLKTLLMACATAMVATVATGYCPINAALDDRHAEKAQWRTLKTYRVEP